jgi:dTDP-4-dehydrorhamnose 3,5-epimerase
MKFVSTNIPEVFLIEPAIFGDHRGFFMETWEKQRFSDAGISNDFVQDNHSRSKQNTLRGLHYQEPYGQGKLVRVVAGEVYDVAVDIRKGSPTFGSYYAAILSEENKHQLWVPPGFAHGFCVLSESADFVYKCSEFYHPEAEHTILWNDPDIGIDWPIEDVILSDKDKSGSLLKDAGTLPVYKQQ